MRILLTSDLHYRLRQYDWLAGAARSFDALVIAGDHLDAFLPVPPEVQIAALSASLARIAAHAPLFASSGNHDLSGRNVAGEKVADWVPRLRARGLAVDGDSVVLGDTLFSVCPWWDGPHARAGLEAMLDDAASRRVARWVWVYHAPPQGPLSWTGKRHFADPLLAALVARHMPTAVLCGHIHEAPFRRGGSWCDRIGDTWLFNAGNQIGEVPARVEIDFDAGLARWLSLAGAEERRLADQ
jgi:Icc-related predicted phosphoesterase